MNTELLAPAKNKEIAILAIDCGADAVYIGASSFGARSKAVNSLSDIKEVVDYAHKFYTKVYVTVNTILNDKELDEVSKLIQGLYDIGVDALIVQDMGILKLAIDKKIPPIHLHISTQCNNRDLEKIKFFNELGISRVVLARELSVAQIKEIIDNTDNLEIETFIHGALCVSYSGQCYLSQFIGGRSANKGECAQPCRKKYTLIDDRENVILKDKHLLSIKDFNATKHLKNLVDIGVKSYKIEGRLKDETYIKNVVLYYRNQLDEYSSSASSGKVFTDFIPNINKSFNRGYTDYFLRERSKCFNFDTPKFIGEKIGKVVKIERNYFILDSDIELSSQDGLCFGKSAEIGCLVNKFESGRIYPNRMPEISIGVNVYRNIDTEYENKLKSAKIKRQIGVDVKVKDDFIYLEDEDKNRISIKIESSEKAKNQEKMNETFVNHLKKTGESDFYVQNISLGQDIPFMPVSSVNELRRVAFDTLMTERIKNYKRDIQPELKYVNFYKNEEDYRANVFNQSAKEFYENCNCNIKESALEKSIPRRKIELMRTKHCIKYALDMCKSSKKLILVDEKGQKYPLEFDCKNCEMVVLNN